jgi:ethanolamine utilization microcompartment shell protein EutS
VAQLTLRWRLRGGLGLAAMVDGRVAVVARDIGYRDGENRTIHLATLSRFSGGVALGPTFEF